MKFILKTVGAVLFLLFLAPVYVNVLNFANSLGMGLSVVLILYGTFFDKVNLFIVNWRKKPICNLIFYFMGFLIAVCVGFCTVITYFMADAADNPPKEATTVVVLGCKVNPSGPSIMLTSRLEAAYDFLSENKDAVCILSGGKGEDEPLSEARAMYDWLTKKGIDKNRLYIEDKSTSTRENLAFSEEIIKENSLPEKITIITNEFHQYRASEIAQKLEKESYSYSAKTPFYLFPTYYVREVFAIAYEMVM